MPSVPAGKRLWKCPDCGQEVLLSITQLDPLGCEACLAKLKGGSSPSEPSSSAASATGSVLKTMQAQPEIVKLAGVGIVALVAGLLTGFVAGRVTAPAGSADSAKSSSASSRSAEPEKRVDDVPNEATRPGPGYKWVRGYTRKDGVKVKGHWARDPHYVEPDHSPAKKRTK